MFGMFKNKEKEKIDYTWNELIENKFILEDNLETGKVYKYFGKYFEYFRFVPKNYSKETDAFYLNYYDKKLSNLITTKSNKK